jgi:competence protein ComGC
MKKGYIMKVKKRVSNFTLLELLIIIAIIGILVTILLPSLTKARHQAKRSVCLSNLKQQGIGSHLYMAKDSSKIPMFINHHPNQIKRPPFDGYDGDLTQELGEVTNNSFELLYCPLGNLSINTDNGGYGGYAGNFDWIFMSYNFVGFFEDGNGGTGWGNHYFLDDSMPRQTSSGRISTNIPLSLGQIQNPSEIALSVDAQATWNNTFRGHPSWPTWAGWEFYFGHQINGQWEGASAVYFDGSARHGYRRELLKSNESNYGGKYMMNYNSGYQHLMFWK